MSSALHLVTLTLFLTAASQRSFVDTAPASQQEVPVPGLTKTQDANVKELESLKHTLGKTLAMMKSHSQVYSNENGHQEMDESTKEEVKSDGKLLARMEQHIDSESNGAGSKPQGIIQTEVEIPSKGVHTTSTQRIAPEEGGQFTQNGNRRTFKIDTTSGAHDQNNNVEKFTSYSGVQYTPLDMAEYVFWTGDEKGVTLAIEEFLQEGMMTREEAITFLQEIKYNLDYLQTHYSQQGLHSQDHSKDRSNNGLMRNLNKPTSLSDRPSLMSDSGFDTTLLRQDLMKKHTLKASPTINNKAEVYEAEKLQQQQQQQRDVEAQSVGSTVDEDYEELLERLKVADFLYTEYSLEEVIYQLAKVMFTQSLTRGNSDAQQALQKFTNFLETEAEDGHISRSLEKKVLDVLIAALTDTLTEHPELDSAAQSAMATSTAETNLLKQFLGLGTAQQRLALKTLKEQEHHQLQHNQQQQQQQQQGTFATANNNVRVQMNQKSPMSISNAHSLNAYKNL